MIAFFKPSAAKRRFQEVLRDQSYSLAGIKAELELARISQLSSEAAVPVGSVLMKEENMREQEASAPKGSQDSTQERPSRLLNLTRRSDEAELMDTEPIGFEEFHACLQELEVINYLTLAYRPTLQWLGPRLKCLSEATILDVGSGGGDMLRKIERRLLVGGDCGAELIGVDLNPWSKKSAEISGHSSRIRHVTADVFSFDPEKSVDFIVCSLFAHHLTDDQLVQFLRWLDGRARRGWFINDLHRHPIPYHFIKVATRLFSRNRLIRHDAAVSVARAFTSGDWHRLLGQAGMNGRAQIEWFFPFRLCVSCDKQQWSR